MADLSEGLLHLLLDEDDDDDEKTEDTDGSEQELLLRRQIQSMPCELKDAFVKLLQLPILSMSCESKDAVVKLLQLPKRQHMLLLSAVKLDESGSMWASNDSRNAGSPSSAGYPADVGAGNPPRADVGAGYPPNVGAGSGYRPNVGTGNPPRRADVKVRCDELVLEDERDMEVVAELERKAEAGGQDPLKIEIDEHFKVAETLEFHFEKNNRWFYLLKCTLCERMAVTKSHNGDGPVKWALDQGWTRPVSGTRKWKKCRPKCGFRKSSKTSRRGTGGDSSSWVGSSGWTCKRSGCRVGTHGCQDPLQIDMPFRTGNGSLRVDRTVEFNFGTGNRWFYLLKCTLCKRMAMGRAMGR